MKNEVTISIITATWNSVLFVANCMDSISQQDYKKYEHIIVDGASTDGTIDLINKLLRANTTFISEPDKGIYDAFNKGISLSSGEVIGFLNSDDFYASSSVLTHIAEVFKDPSVCAVYGDLEYVSRQDSSKAIRRWKGDQFNQKNLNYGWMPAHPTFYVRRKWYSRIGNFDSSYNISADYLSVLKLFSYPDFKVAYIPKCMVKMRLGGASNKSLSLIFKKSLQDWMALRSCHFGVTKSALSLFCKNARKFKQLLT